MLKNCTTNRYKSLMKIKAKKRLLLTGTPLQNNLVELISLMHFVMPDLFYKHTENLRDLLALFQCVLDQLPKKHEFIEYCHLIDNQLELYGNLVSECARALKKESSNSKLSNNDARCFIMQLRKAANHPLLLRTLYTDDKLCKMTKSLCKEKSHRDADPKLVQEDMSVMSDFELSKLCAQHKALNRYKLAGKFIGASAKFQKLDEILPAEKNEGNKVLLFSQFTMVLDIMEEYLKQRKHKYLRLDGQTPVVERQVLIDQFNTNSDLFVFLLSTKAGGLGINLTSANVIILHDIDYNPYNDRQAEDRCHRVGQTKEVKVLRLIAKNTIDETMLACAKRKLDLEKQVTADEDNAENEDMESLLKQALMMTVNVVTCVLSYLASERFDTQVFMSFFKKKKSVNDEKKYVERLQRQQYLAKFEPTNLVDYSDCNLNQIPSGTFSLCNLFLKEVLILHTNRLKNLREAETDSDSEIDSDPDYFKKLSNLRVFDLHNNQLDRLPSQICHLINLQYLNLENNQYRIRVGSKLSGNKIKELPDEIGQLNSLRTLDISLNLITKLPGSLINLKCLEVLLLDQENMEYPKSDICAQGTTSILKFLCDGKKFKS
uniref:Helicase C-terminal domain-containing protein n=1 Tax=Romanomermis culicivorax TaxID=13658 RepID=A0A915JJ26_ROMCU